MTPGREAVAGGGVRRDDASDDPPVKNPIPAGEEDEAREAREEKERLDREAGDVADDLADFA